MARAWTTGLLRPGVHRCDARRGRRSRQSTPATAWGSRHARACALHRLRLVEADQRHHAPGVLRRPAAGGVAHSKPGDSSTSSATTGGCQRGGGALFPVAGGVQRFRASASTARAARPAGAAGPHGDQPRRRMAEAEPVRYREALLSAGGRAAIAMLYSQRSIHAAKMPMAGAG